MFWPFTLAIIIVHTPQSMLCCYFVLFLLLLPRIYGFGLNCERHKLKSLNGVSTLFYYSKDLIIIVFVEK